MKIHILYNSDNGCDYHRLVLPSYHFKLSPQDSIKYFEFADILSDQSIYECDILFLSRISLIKWEALKHIKEQYGFKIVVDIDDYYKLPKNHIMHKAWNTHGMEERITQAATNADYVFVTNEQLYNVYKSFNSKVTIIPNALPFDVEPFIPNTIESSLTRFIYVSGSSHYNDIKEIKGFLQRIGSDGEFTKNGELIVCGYTNSFNSKRNIWHHIESVAKVSRSYKRRAGLPLLQYMQHYNHGDVSIAPLEDSFFNTCKSNLKFVEAACMKKPFICSNILPYTIDANKTIGIKFCDSNKDWYKAFKYFLNNKNAIKELGELNYEYAKLTYNINSANLKRMDIFNSLL